MQRNDFFFKTQLFIKFYYHFIHKKATFLHTIVLFSSLLFLFW